MTYQGLAAEQLGSRAGRLRWAAEGGGPQLVSTSARESRAPDDAPRASLSERVSAVVALVSLAAALLLLALNMALRIGAFTLALAGLLACVTACWYMVARRGLIRILAMLAAVIALGAIVAGLVLAVISVWIVVAVAGLGLISVISARGDPLHRSGRSRAGRAAGG